MKFAMKKYLLTLILAVSGILASGQVANVMPYQGYIANSSGTPYTGNYTFRFELLDGSSNQLYNSGLVTIAVTEGEYSVTLGLTPTPALADSIFLNHDATQLRISFDDGVQGLETLTPNVQLYPVPYTHRAMFADKVNNSSAYIGDSIVLRDSTGDVRLVMNPNTGTIKWMDNDTVWKSIAVNSPEYTVTVEHGWKVESWHDKSTGKRRERTTDTQTGKVVKEVITEKVDGVMQETTYEYNNDTLIAKTIKSGKIECTWSFNSDGDTIGVMKHDTTPDGKHKFEQKTFDDDGTLRMHLTRNGNKEEVKEYDSNGNLIRHEVNDYDADEDYNSVVHNYDSTGKVTSIERRGREGTKIEFIDSTGKQISYVKTDRSGGGITVGSDSTGRSNYITSDKWGIEDDITDVRTHVTVDSNGHAEIQVDSGNGSKTVTLKMNPKTGNVELIGTGGNKPSVEMKNNNNTLGIYSEIPTLNNPGLGVFDSGSGNSVIIEGDAANQQWNIFGNTQINGNLAKLSGTFKIDHPQYPTEKYLIHSFVESPDMMNIYNGNITTDANGFATVEMPDYFESLNVDFRYQLTVIGTFAQAIVKDKIKTNSFVIQTNEPNVEVSWQVTGVRNDDWARENRIVPVVDKKDEELGTRLYTPKSLQPESQIGKGGVQ